MKIDHITAIVGSRRDGSAALMRLLGVSPTGSVTLPGMEISTFEVEGVAVHVNAPTGPGPVQDHHRAHGDGFHHLALSTDDLDLELRRLERQGFRTLGAPVTTAPGLREVFLDPATTGGLLIQIVERTLRGRPEDLDPIGIDRLTQQPANRR